MSAEQIKRTGSYNYRKQVARPKSGPKTSSLMPKRPLEIEGDHPMWVSGVCVVARRREEGGGAGGR